MTSEWRDIRVFSRLHKQAGEVGPLGRWNFIYIIFFDFSSLFLSDELENAQNLQNSLLGQAKLLIFVT